MPKAYDITRNYYADLELPSNASIDDIKKQYRKLAKIWHPDRNAGNEESCVPRFQAIQAAHEILSDPVNKAQYDADRRVAGPFKSAAPAAGPVPRGNPYQATSNFPPPPRRTQPGQWQRPQFRPTANGAERFSNFAGANVQPPKRSDAAQDRANAFYRAHQNQKAQERQQQQQQQQQQREAQAAASGPSTPAAQNPSPRRPQPPPRADTTYPSEEKVRPAFKHSDTSAFDTEAENRRSAWQAFKGNSTTPEPGVRRSNTTRTPKRQGFDPNAPGSDERPAAGHYVHRHKSEDFGQPPSPAEDASDLPKPQRPHIDPTNPHRRKPSPDDVPFFEANRKRTPYTSFVGEKTDVSSNMRRSKSWLDSNSGMSPDNTTPPEAFKNRKGATFEFPTVDSDAESPGAGSSPELYESPFAKPPHLPTPTERVKKVPSPPSKRFNGNQSSIPADGTDEAKKDNIFNFGNAAPFSPPPMPTGKSRSEENINTKFAQDFSGTFAGTANSTQPRPPSRQSPANFVRQNSRGRVKPTFGQPSPLGTNFVRSDLPPPPTSAPAGAAQARAFSPEEWQQHFADGTWVAPPPPPGGPKPTTPASATQDTVSPTGGKARDSGFSNGDDRMDIDDVPPSQVSGDRQAMPPPPKPPRPVPVPPSKWHQQQSAQIHTNLKTNLDDLSHVEPIARESGAGLGDLSHLSADLPFKSQASQPSPISLTGSQHLRIPTIPIPPVAPAIMTKQTWVHYMAEFGMYIAAFHDFQGRVLLHFNTRQTAAKIKIEKGMDWLQAAGGPDGFVAYAQQVKTDAKLREAWNLACEKHFVAVRQFEDFRERIKRAVAAGGLVDR